MKILVVSYLFSAVRDAIQKDGDSPKGMPGFLNAMEYFFNRGVDIDYIFVTTVRSDLEILNNRSKVPYIQNEQIKKIIVKKSRLNRYTKNIFMHHDLISAVDEVVANNDYSFIYLMTPEATCVNKYANKKGIPCGARFFGTFLWSYIKENGYNKAKIFFHEELKAYNTPKSFLLTTNDGSNGDDSYNSFCKNKSIYEFHYWINGLNRLSIDEKRKEKIQSTISENDIVYVARIAQWKRQDRALELIKKLKDRGINSKLLLVGECSPEHQSWKQEINKMIDTLDVKENVEFLGSMEREDFLYLAMKAKVCPLFQDTTNMGNVFHELFSVGAVIVALNDGSLDGFIDHGKNGFLVNTIDEAADICANIIMNKIDLVEIRGNAISTSTKLISTWDERIERELQLIKKYAKN